jgi:hypothetical protein
MVHQDSESVVEQATTAIDVRGMEVHKVQILQALSSSRSQLHAQEMHLNIDRRAMNKAMALPSPAQVC